MIKVIDIQRALDNEDQKLLTQYINDQLKSCVRPEETKELLRKYKNTHELDQMLEQYLADQVLAVQLRHVTSVQINSEALNTKSKHQEFNNHATAIMSTSEFNQHAITIMSAPEFASDFMEHMRSERPSLRRPYTYF